ncbi:MAG: hypothetical protein ACRD8Z_09530 [Nitrososphaeraceae archaeon]
MLYSALINDKLEAQVSENTLESIANETKVLSSAQVSVGDSPNSIVIGNAVYVANWGSDTVSVISRITNTVVENIRWKKPSFHLCY